MSLSLCLGETNENSAIFLEGFFGASGFKQEFNVKALNTVQAARSFCFKKLKLFFKKKSDRMYVGGGGCYQDKTRMCLWS